jgi:hypothetical protein
MPSAERYFARADAERALFTRYAILPYVEALKRLCVFAMMLRRRLLMIRFQPITLIRSSFSFATPPYFRHAADTYAFADAIFATH